MTCKYVLHRNLHALSTSSNLHNLPSQTLHNCMIDINYTRLLSSCKDFKSLLQIHGHSIISGFKQDTSVNAHLVKSYSLFKKCDFARSVFDSTPNPDVVLYNSLIRAYTRTNQHREALKLYYSMIERNLEPDKYTFTFVLKACTGVLCLEEGFLVHKQIVDKGLECDQFIATGLIDMYGKMGELRLATEVFDKMRKRDVVAWNAIIAGFSQSSDPHEALELFKSMRFSGVEPDIVSFLNLVPAVSKSADMDSCRSIHGYVIRRGFDEVLSNGLIDMYCKCGDALVARHVFDGIQVKNDVSWGTMMAGYAHNRCFFEVLELFNQIKNEDRKMNKVSVGSALLAAGEIGDLERGKEIRDCVMQQNIGIDILLATSIMIMYAKCGEFEKAKKLFGELPERDLVAWSAIITAFVQSGHPEEALSLFRNMQTNYLRPNCITLASILPACAQLLLSRLGKSVHCYALRGNIDSDISTGTALVSMYVKCGFFSVALTVFNRMPCKDVITWNALISGYIQVGFPCRGIEIFHELGLSEISPDLGTMASLLQACLLLNDLGLGSYIHGQIIKYGFQSYCHVMNALVNMYAKCGNLSSAELLFYRTDFEKDEVSWNTIIAGYVQNGHAKDSISAFHHMRLENFRPNEVTIVSVLPATAYLVAITEGLAIHACIIRMGFNSNTLVGNSLIDMYAKCGSLNSAEKYFDEMEYKDTVSWNAMLAGYALHGQGNRAISLFLLMQEQNLKGDSISFLNVLSACRHSGLVEEGREIFESMSENHRDLEHYACMVDLLGRAGLFDEALEFIMKMPIKPDAGVWGALLNACREQSNVQMGEVALDHLVELEPENPANYVVLTSIYAESGRWNDADDTKSKMNERGLMKTPGCSWVEVGNQIRAFRVGDHNNSKV